MLHIGLIILSLLMATPTAAVEPAEHRFEFTYSVLAGEFPNHGAVDLYVPLPVEDAHQQILDTRIESSIPGEIGVEPVYGNRYYRVHRPANVNGPISVDLTWTVTRSRVLAQEGVLDETDRERYLQSNNLVPVGHEMLDPIRAEVHALRADESPQATARAIYDWVVDNVEYKKVGTGWGNGDTFWACSERYGNCTDFHALFIALARSEGIPARFEMGFPVPTDRLQGAVSGYHCWVQMYVPGTGWLPVDASEAAKHPQDRERYYGSQPADRVHLSTGRDLVLSPASESQPLNYFVYPYVEVAGVPWKVDLETRFSYRLLNTDSPAI